MASIKKAKAALTGRGAQLKRQEKAAMAVGKKKTKVTTTPKKKSKYKSFDQLRKEALAKKAKQKKGKK